MMKITGLAEMEKQFRDAGKALATLDGKIGTLEFDPNDPTSVDAAIREMERTIDRKVAQYRNNPIVKETVAGMKKEYRAAIRKQAKEARAEG